MTLDTLVEKYRECEGEAGCEVRRNKLFNKIQGLMKKRLQSLSYQLIGKEDEDLISCGIAGLFKALQRYNPDHKTKFATYADFYMKGAMLHYLRENYNLVRIPAKRYEDALKDGKTYSSFFKFYKIEDIDAAYKMPAIPLSCFVKTITGKNAVFSKFLSLRLQGYNVPEASKMMGLSENAGYYINSKLKSRYKTIFKKEKD